MRKDTRSKVRRAVRLLASAMGIKLEQSHSQKGKVVRGTMRENL
jgi:hypothetical protein